MSGVNLRRRGVMVLAPSQEGEDWVVVSMEAEGVDNLYQAANNFHSGEAECHTYNDPHDAIATARVLLTFLLPTPDCRQDDDAREWLHSVFQTAAERGQDPGEVGRQVLDLIRRRTAAG